MDRLGSPLSCGEPHSADQADLSLREVVALGQGKILTVHYQQKIGLPSDELFAKQQKPILGRTLLFGKEIPVHGHGDPWRSAQPLCGKAHEKGGQRRVGQDQVKVLPTEKTPYFQQRKEVLWGEHLLAKGGFVRKRASVPHYANVKRL